MCQDCTLNTYCFLAMSHSEGNSSYKKTKGLSSTEAKEVDEGGTFTCYKCQLTERYSYYGRTPGFLKKMVFLENCYVIPNPFVARGSEDFIVLGSNCCACDQSVCQGAQCSVFYTKRFCRDCAKANIGELPAQVALKIR